MKCIIHCECSPDGRAPLEGQCKGRPRCIVHAEVEQEATHGGDDEEGGDRVLFQAQGRRAVDGPKEEPERVQPRDE